MSESVFLKYTVLVDICKSLTGDRSAPSVRVRSTVRKVTAITQPDLKTTRENKGRDGFSKDDGDV